MAVSTQRDTGSASRFWGKSFRVNTYCTFKFKLKRLPGCSQPIVPGRPSEQPALASLHG